MRADRHLKQDKLVLFFYYNQNYEFHYRFVCDRRSRKRYRWTNKSELTIPRTVPSSTSGIAAASCRLAWMLVVGIGSIICLAVRSLSFTVRRWRLMPSAAMARQQVRMEAGRSTSCVILRRILLPLYSIPASKPYLDKLDNSAWFSNSQASTSVQCGFQWRLRENTL